VTEEAPAPGCCKEQCCGGDAGAPDPVQEPSSGSTGEEEGEPHLASLRPHPSSEFRTPIPSDQLGGESEESDGKGKAYPALSFLPQSLLIGWLSF